jgi:methylmalonyl-CoA/ethylmalonyl-CoA epimerase
MVIDHIGIVVSSLTDSINYWKNVFGYKQQTDIVINTRQKVKVVFLTKKDSTMVKLLEPLNETSTIYLFARRGGGLHHLCFKCSNLIHKLGELNGLGMRTITQPEPGEAFENEPIAFLHSSQNLYIELIDTEKKAGIIDYL